MVNRRLRKLCIGVGVVILAGISVTAQAAPTPLNWGAVSTAQTPPAREFAAMAFDSARNRTVLFGGGDAAFNYLSDTWEFDSAAWIQRKPSTSPPGMLGMAMAFDSKRNVTVMFGGTTSSAASSSTWEWEGTSWTLRTFTTEPSARFWSTMAYDSARGRIVLFGGSNNSDLGDTWEYDGTTWIRMAPAASPPARSQAAMAYDPGIGRVVLFGGRAAGQRLADTWEWDGSNWTQLTPSSTPFPRSLQSMAFDPQVGHVVLFAGDHIEPYGLGPTNDTWEWDGSTWTQDWTSVTPIARSGQSMALGANGRLVMFGGSNGLLPGVFYADTEELGLGIATPPGNPAVSLPASQDFGTVDVGTTSAAAIQAVVNSGTGPLLATIATTGDFSVSSTYCPMSPNPLAVGATCFVFYTFTPTAGGDRYGTLVFTGNLPGGSQSMQLHGVGLAADFSISASPSNVGALQGVTVTTTISTTAIGQTGTIALSFLSTDQGLTATFNPASVTAGGTATMTITVGPGVPLGGQGIDAVGTEGLAAHRASIFVSVLPPPTDFSISASPSNMTLVQGTTGTSTVSTALLTGLGGSISLDPSVSAGGVQPTLSPMVINAGASATLTILAFENAVPGVYTVTVKGTLGSVVHSTSLTVTVVAAPRDFTISSSPAAASVVQGSGLNSAIATTQIDNPGTVNLSASSSPAGLTAIVAPSSISAGTGSTLVIIAPIGTAPGSYTVTVTGIEGFNTHSTTVSVTVTVKGIVNGGFETGDLTGWTASGSAAAIPFPHSGSYAGQIGSSSASADSWLAQTFTVPATGGKLTFWFLMSCPDKVKNDWFKATMVDGVTGATRTLQAPVCSKKMGWAKVTANLSPNAGHYVTITLLTHDDGNPANPTFTLVDDVKLS